MSAKLHPWSIRVSPDVISELAPTGALRAGINLSNFLLVTKLNSTGDPEGAAPDLAHEVAIRLNVPVKYVPFKSPGELAEVAAKGILGYRANRRRTPARRNDSVHSCLR
jgi:hypothetical protein